MKVYPPDGAIGKPPRALAASRPTLRGLRIGVLDNAKPNARVLMARAAEQVAQRTGASFTLVTTKGPGRNAATACSDEVLSQLTKEVDLVFTGSAD